MLRRSLRCVLTALQGCSARSSLAPCLPGASTQASGGFEGVSAGLARRFGRRYHPPVSPTVHDSRGDPNDSLAFLSAAFRTHPDLVARQIAGEMVLVRVVENVAQIASVYVLNDTGSTIWSLLAAGPRGDEVVRALVSDFDVSEETARTDVEEFLRDLGSAGLVTRQA